MDKPLFRARRTPNDFVIENRVSGPGAKFEFRDVDCPL